MTTPSITNEYQRFKTNMGKTANSPVKINPDIVYQKFASSMNSENEQKTEANKMFGSAADNASNAKKEEEKVPKDIDYGGPMLDVLAEATENIIAGSSSQDNVVYENDRGIIEEAEYRAKKAKTIGEKKMLASNKSGTKGMPKVVAERTSKKSGENEASPESTTTAEPKIVNLTWGGGKVKEQTEWKIEATDPCFIKGGAYDATCPGKWAKAAVEVWNAAGSPTSGPDHEEFQRELKRAADGGKQNN